VDDVGKPESCSIARPAGPQSWRLRPGVRRTGFADTAMDDVAAVAGITG